MKINVTDSSTEQGMPFLPSAEYTLRCISVEKKESKAKNPMLVFQWEFCAPDVVTIQVGDAENRRSAEIRIAGLKTTDWIVLAGKGEAQGKTKLKVLNKYTKLPDELDIDDPTQLKPYVGKAVKAYVTTEGGVMIDEVTQRPIVDGDGHPVTNNNYRIKRFVAADDSFTIPADAVAY